MSAPQEHKQSNAGQRVSAVLIVRNEAQKIAACLATLDWADEVVVLDSGSEDDTCAIAREHGARVSVRTDWQGFGEQRRRAEALATGDWIFMIDADERVTPELRDSILAAVARATPAIYRANRLCWCFGRYIRHSDMHPDWVARLYPKGEAEFPSQRVHEKLHNPKGLPEYRLEGKLLHWVYDSVAHQKRKAAHYAEEWAAERMAKGRTTSLSSAYLHAIFCFVRMYFLRLGLLDGRQGFLLAVLMSQATFAKYAELWTRSRTKNPEDDHADHV